MHVQIKYYDFHIPLVRKVVPLAADFYLVENKSKEETTELSDVSLSPIPMDAEDGPDVEIVQEELEASPKQSGGSGEEESSDDSDSSTESDQGEY